MGQSQGAASQPVTFSVVRKGSSLGVASLVLGAIAFGSCWIPLIGMLGVPLSAVGLALGGLGFLVALFRKGAGIGYPIAGVTICGLSLGIAIAVNGAVVTAVDTLGKARRASAGATRTELTASKPAEPVFASIDSPVVEGDLQIQVRAVSVRKVKLESLMKEQNESKELQLVLELRVKNVSATRKLSYHSWGDSNRSVLDPAATLNDNFGNTYAMRRFDEMSGPVGWTEFASLYPGKELDDVLVFEPPVDAAKSLDLELPADVIGNEGVIRFRIPTSSIVSR